MYYLGVDVGGTNIAVGIVDENNAIIAKASHPTPVPCSEDAFCDAILAVCNDALAKAGLTLDDVPWIGIGCPGTVNRATGIIEFANNLYFKNFKLRDMMAERTNGKLVILENDANAAAYGEYQAGALAGADNALAITLGTGVGGGIIIDDKVYSGFNFAGAELGHIVIEKDGRQCTCGRRGCWEAYSSATGLIRTTREKVEECRKTGRETVIETMISGDLDRISGKTAFKAMRAGDEVGKEIVEEYISYLTTGLVNIINIFQPNVLSIGGGISNEGDALIDMLHDRVFAETYSRDGTPQCTLKIAKLKNDAGIIGAAALGM